MLPELASPPIAGLPHQPELRLLLADLDIQVAAEVSEAFVLQAGRILLGAPVLAPSNETLFHLRHAMELAWLATTARPALAGLAAARCAALAIVLETYGSAGATLPGWIAPLTGYAAPDLSIARRIWAKLAVHQPEAPDAMLSAQDHARLVDAWAILGPTEWLMEQGGDARLGVDPFTGLNGYGCSHRPRPWAVTFASSTASSCSERGYLGAEMARRRMIRASFAQTADSAIVQEAAYIRAGLAQHFDLPADTAIVLAPSGTDAELMALALAEAAEERPITNILLAPEETGSGVPLAARGRHFAVDTARGLPVAKGDVVPGYREDTELVPIAVRGADGSVRSPVEVDRDCVAAVEVAIAAGRRPILHILDVSKTGLRAPSRSCAAALGARFAGRMDVIVDACQARLNPGTIRDYVGRGWMVLMTGSKFFTGPPFAGALLAPGAVAHRLAAGPLPAGLSLYCGSAEWPSDLAGTDCLRADDGRPGGNFGLMMRWQAALAEMQAFAEVPRTRRRSVLHRFVGHVEECIARTDGLTTVTLQEAEVDPEEWDLTATIRCFALSRMEPDADGQPAKSAPFLDLAEARKVYIWLNADLGPALAALVPAEDHATLSRRCHIGQPVAVTIDAVPAAALRVSAGARLVSGEPSHAHLDPDERLERELSDATLLFRKVALILKHFDHLSTVNPRPSYA
ncbi:MAG TPA: hypothetical protein VL752_16955 [Acidisoma sp.]|uniref:hypothetical protein n=1 Tax=Acidisoma sp. TaxID=1872115 RepID=UPI002CC356AE|nr:hypothetical protein [Acidisoma sp.]HTI02642.1 hypothetical protein [Acidisoma sp.]